MKHRTTFCYSFYYSGHDPAIAFHEMTDFFQYLDAYHSIQLCEKSSVWPGLLALRVNDIDTIYLVLKLSSVAKNKHIIKG